MLDLRNMDCMDLMQEFPEKYFHLAIVDPPYGISVKTNIGRRAGVYNANPPAEWDKEPPPAGYFNELKRISRNQIIFGANHFIERMPWNSSEWVLWDKMFSNDVTFAAFEMAYTSFNGTTKKFTLSPNQPHRIHPTQKPVALYRWLLANYAKPGDKILDTHLGSGSIAIACHYMGFDLIGSEIDADYYSAMIRRVEHETAQIEFDIMK